jgi:hypothetical protein
MNVLHKLTSEATTTKRPAQPRRVRDPIIAAITGSDSAVVMSISVRSTSPLLCLCRALLRAGTDPNRPLRAFRGDVLALTIRSLADGARLEVNQHGTGFTARRERRAAPSIAAATAAHTERPGCAERACEAARQRTPEATE